MHNEDVFTGVQPQLAKLLPNFGDYYTKVPNLFFYNGE